ncbi:uncharacterized protein LOC143919921 [Arctopsyche grandis]|uniref:uncharacterized protein LOC143919921 n=1 Tax=Arctopsyche grandis TaxID=121162 RepID=UPI00406D9738
MNLFKSCCKRVSDDFKLKELLPMKLLFFAHVSTFYVFYPYLTIHMRSLGITLEETAIITSVIPLIAIFIPPVAGLIGDKIGNYRLVLVIVSILCGLSSLSLLMVPVGRVHVVFPERAEMTIGCSSDVLSLDASEYSCEPLHPYAYDVDMKLESCGFVCKWSSDDEDNSSMPIHKALSYAVKIRNPIEGATEVFRYPLGSHDRPIESTLLYENSVKNLKSNIRYKTALRQISVTSLFFPTNGMYDLDCKKSVENSTEFNCELGTNGTSFTKSSFTKHSLNKFLAKVMPLNDLHVEETLPLSHHARSIMLKQFNVNGFSEMKTESDLADKNVKPSFAKPTCVDNIGVDDEEVSIEILFQEMKSKGESISTTIQLDECTAKCLVTAPREQLCSNKNEEIDINVQLTFWSYLTGRVFLSIISSTGAVMFEGAVIALLREYGGDYGLQKLYGIVGAMISSPLSGILIDYISRDKDYKDFRPAIILYAVLKVLCAFLMLTINLEFKPPAKNLMSDVISVLKHFEIIVLFVAVFILGMAWGYIESFLFWLLQDLGASNSLMGITVTVGGFGAIPVLLFSGPLIDKIGQANVLFIGFIFYSIRLFGYSLIYNPWMSLIFEALEGITTPLTFTAAVTYAARLSGATTDTTIQGLLGGLYHGVGKGAGSLVGGYMMNAIGTRLTYQIFAGVSMITGCIYFLFNKFYIARNTKHQDKTWQKNPKGKDVESCPKADAANGKPQNEKMPLKDCKNNVSLYMETNPNNSIKGEECQNEQIADDSKRSIITKEIEVKKDGVDNPVFEEIDLPVEANCKDESKNVPESKQVEDKSSKKL